MIYVLLVEEGGRMTVSGLAETSEEADERFRALKRRGHYVELVECVVNRKPVVRCGCCHYCRSGK